MKYIKTMFDTGINSWFISMYSDGTKIKLIEENPETDETGNETVFQNKTDYSNWIDKVADEETAVYNQTLSLQLLFKAIAKESNIEEYMHVYAGDEFEDDDVYYA